jgi:hypothetical protein
MAPDERSGAKFEDLVPAFETIPYSPSLCRLLGGDMAGALLLGAIVRKAAASQGNDGYTKVNILGLAGFLGTGASQVVETIHRLSRKAFIRHKNLNEDSVEIGLQIKRLETPPILGCEAAKTRRTRKATGLPAGVEAWFALAWEEYKAWVNENGSVGYGSRKEALANLTALVAATKELPKDLEPKEVNPSFREIEDPLQLRLVSSIGEGIEAYQRNLLNCTQHGNPVRNCHFKKLIGRSVEDALWAQYLRQDRAKKARAAAAAGAGSLNDFVGDLVNG